MARISFCKGENDGKNGEGEGGTNGEGTNGVSILKRKGLLLVLLLLLCRVEKGDMMLLANGEKMRPPKGPQIKLSSNTASNISSSMLHDGLVLLILQGDGGGCGGGGGDDL